MIPRCRGACGCIYLFIPGRELGSMVGEPCHDLGKYRSISCPFNALVFVIHGFSSTLNRITWLLCKDSGLGTLLWETPWLWPQGLIYNTSYTPMSIVHLRTLPVNVYDLESWTSCKLWSVIFKSIFQSHLNEICKSGFSLPSFLINFCSQMFKMHNNFVYFQYWLFQFNHKHT